MSERINQLGLVVERRMRDDHEVVETLAERHSSVSFGSSPQFSTIARSTGAPSEPR